MSTYHNQNTLYYIDALLKYSNYGKAAQSLYISQPYLTQVIKRIEKQLQCELINRSKLPYRLTEQGKVYYEYLTSLEKKHAKLMRDLTAMNDMDKTIIKIGVLPSLGTYLLPLFIPQFLSANPQCHIELFEALPETNERQLQNGELDFWIGQNSSNISPNFTAISWGLHRYYAIIPNSSNLYERNIAVIPEGSMNLSELLSQPLVLTSKGSAIRKQLDQLLSVYKIEANIVLESSEIYSVKKLSMGNLGVTFIPESLSLHPNPEAYNIYPIPKEELNLDYFIAYDTKKVLTSIDKDLIDSFVLQKDENNTIGDSHV